MFKKISAFIAALTITASAASTLPINNMITANAASESRIDLSVENEKFFPAVYNQSYGSCVSFASTYYQMTYEVRKAYFEKYGTAYNYTISPAFVFNHLNNGGTGGSLLELAYRFIKGKGVLTTDDAKLGYWDTAYFEGRPEYLIKALRTRIDEANLIKTNYSNEDETIEKIKEQLRNGKVVTTEGNFNYDYYVNSHDRIGRPQNDRKYRVTANNGEYAYVQNTQINEYKYTDSEGKEQWDSGYVGHAFTIVGYDDDITAEYNGTTLKGAFKILNSWGTGWGNKGYMWIMYDAFYQNSKQGIVCDDDSRHRVAAFSSDNFYTVDVDFKDIKLVAEADIDTADQSCVSLWTTKLESGKTLGTQERFDFTHLYNTSDNKPVNFKGSVVDDINGLCDDDYFSNKSYKVEVQNIPNKKVPLTVKSVSLRDDLGNIVAQKTVEHGKNGAYIDLNLKRGDINYDGIINSADTEMIRDYITNGHENEFSTLQKELMDVNNDGKVNVIDAETVNFIDTGRYITENGDVYTGWHLINNGYYFLDENGYKVTNSFIDDENKNETYFVNADGLCVKSCMFTFDGSRYYADELGYIIKDREYDVALKSTGISRIFSFDENGRAVLGWNADKTKYYSEAGMYTGWHIIDGENIFFDENGFRS